MRGWLTASYQKRRRLRHMNGIFIFLKAKSEIFPGVLMPVLFCHVILLFVHPEAVGLFQEEKIYTVSDVSIKPEPVRGLNDFQGRWSKKVAYPEEAIRNKIQGMVFIEFIVGKNGVIQNPEIKSGLHRQCDEAALRGFKEVTKEPWKPGMKDGAPVKVKMVLPFFFRIHERG
jgi:TonB family protein